jgi:predicted membrane protein
MIIDNKLTSTKATLFFWILAFLMVTLYFWTFLNGIKDNIVVLGFAILTTLIYLLLLFSQPFYFSFKDSDEKLTFRFYNAHPFLMKPRAIEINKKLFVKFEVKKSFGGLRKHIILHQRTPKGIAKYPPISVSALGPQQWLKLQKALNMQVTYALKFQKNF